LDCGTNKSAIFAGGINMKKALVMITGSYQLLQAIWFSLRYSGYEYTALIKTANLPSEVQNRLLNYCKKSMIFEHICFTKGVSYDSSMAEKSRLGIKMLICYLTGRKKVLIKKLISQQINVEEYDLILADSEISILGGAFISLAREKNVIIMQEGLYDLQSRRTFPKLNLNDMIGYLIARMGYCNPMQSYKLMTTKYCQKLLSHPDLATYKNFKSLIRLFEMNEAQKKQFNQMIHNVFINDTKSYFDTAEVILFTNVLSAFTPVQKYYDSLYLWMKENFSDKKIAIKKHPRDVFHYDWPDLDIYFIEESLPAEVLMSRITNQKVIFMFFSTCILEALHEEVDYLVLFFSNIKNASYTELFNELKCCLAIDDACITKLD